MEAVKRLLLALDRWQQRHRTVAVAYAVVKKFGDDRANLYVVNLGWYGFTAIYPLLLVVVTIFGFLGSSLGSGLLHTLQKFPVIGGDFTPGKGGSTLHGSVAGLVVGVLGLLYGAQGVTQTAQQTMAEVWNVPQVKRAGFLPRLARSLGGLLTIGAAFFINAFVGGIASGHGHAWWLRIVLTAGLVVLNVGLYYVSFWILTPPSVPDRRLLPGAIVGAVGFTALTTVGVGLVQHQLAHASNTYGAFASVIVLVTYLLLLAKVTVYAAELNPVLVRHLWPRAFPMAASTKADERVLSALVVEEQRWPEQRWPEQRIGVNFQPDPVPDNEIDGGNSAGGNGATTGSGEERFGRHSDGERRDEPVEAAVSPSGLGQPAGSRPPTNGGGWRGPARRPYQPPEWAIAGGRSSVGPASGAAQATAPDPVRARKRADVSTVEWLSTPSVREGRQESAGGEGPGYHAR